MSFTVKNLSIEFRMPNNTIKSVDNISFSVPKGKTLVIVGESGCGKTSTTEAIMGISSGVITSGMAKFSDTDFIPIGSQKFQRTRGTRMAMIFQNPSTSLNPTMIIGEQVAEAKHPFFFMGKAKKLAIDLLNDVQITNPEKRIYSFPFQLSGGMQQRVMIASALANDPEILIADEPTTALDVTIQAQILDLLKAIQARRKMSIILITHDLGVVAKMADFVAVMYKGQIVEYGPVKDIFNKPKHPYTKALKLAMPKANSVTKPNKKNNIVLEIKNLKKYFYNKANEIIKAVDDVNLTINDNEILGLVGESGCGKSTLCRLITGLCNKMEGEILYKEQKMPRIFSAQSFKTYSREIQMIFQDSHAALDPKMTIKEIISEGPLIHKMWNKKEIDYKATEWLEMVGLSEQYLHRYPHELSGGQRQRIGIARACSIEPKLIICDEATSALDVSIKSQIVKLLLNLRAKLNLTMLFVSHDIEIVRCISNRTAVMYLGKIVELGNSDDVFKNPQHPYTKLLIKSVLSPKLSA